MSESSAVPARTLDACERVIEHGIETFIEVGQALLEIRDQRLYRETHATFEEYCKERWRWGRKYVDKQIAAASVASNLTPIGVVPGNEAQVRPLVSLAPEVQREVWSTVTANGSQPTMKQVMAEVSRRVKALLPAPPPRDLKQEREAKELKDKMQRNSEYNYQCISFVDAIEALVSPKLPVPDIAQYIKQYYSYGKDWPTAVSQSQKTLKQFLEELNS